MDDSDLTSDPFICPISSCSKRLGSKFNLKRHIDSFHNGLRPYECEICFKKFSSKQNKKLHSQIEHSYSESEPPLSGNREIEATQEISIPKLTFLASRCKDKDLRQFAKVERIYLCGDDWELVVIPRISAQRRSECILPRIL